MKNLCKYVGKFFLVFASLLIVAGPASLGAVAVEEIPQSINSKR